MEGPLIERTGHPVRISEKGSKYPKGIRSRRSGVAGRKSSAAINYQIVGLGEPLTLFAGASVRLALKAAQFAAQRRSEAMGHKATWLQMKEAAN